MFRKYPALFAIKKQLKTEYVNSTYSIISNINETYILFNNNHLIIDEKKYFFVVLSCILTGMILYMYVYSKYMYICI